MPQVRIVGDGTPAGTRIFVDDVEQLDVAAFKLQQSAVGGPPQLVLYVNATGLEVETRANVEQKPIELTREDVTDMQTEHAFAMVNNSRVIVAIGSMSDATQGVNIPRMALRYVTLPVDVRLSMLCDLGLITDDEKRSASIDDDVRHTLEKDALGRAIDGAAISALDKAITLALNAARQQPSGQQAGQPIDSAAPPEQH